MGASQRKQENISSFRKTLKREIFEEHRDLKLAPKKAGNIFGMLRVENVTCSADYNVQNFVQNIVFFIYSINLDFC